MRIWFLRRREIIGIVMVGAEALLLTFLINLALVEYFGFRSDPMAQLGLSVLGLLAAIWLGMKYGPYLLLPAARVFSRPGDSVCVYTPFDGGAKLVGLATIEKIVYARNDSSTEKPDLLASILGHDPAWEWAASIRLDGKSFTIPFRYLKHL